MDMQMEHEMGEMDPGANEAKVSALKDLIAMMQGLIVEAGGEPDESEGEEMPEAAEAPAGESALADVMGDSESDLGMGNEYKDFMSKGNKIAPKGKHMNVAVGVKKIADAPMSKGKKSKKSKMKRYG